VRAHLECTPLAAARVSRTRPTLEPTQASARAESIHETGGPGRTPDRVLIGAL